ncbi:MAG: hypothetical protein Q8L81_05760 [Bacteroidota bacterium]|nr:hypothetical protein [Bacteroidota bacterium]
MKFFGKTIPTDKINFVMSCISFVLGLIFFIRMQTKPEQPETQNYNSERDSLLIIESRVNTQIREIKKLQESMALTIYQSRVLLNAQQNKVSAKRQQLHSTLKSDWQQISRAQQNAYINKIMSNLKEYQK